MTSPRSLPTSPCELSEGEVTSPSNLKVVGALDNYSLVFVIFINFFGQLKDWVGQVLFLVSCLKGQVEKYVNVEAWLPVQTVPITTKVVSLNPAYSKVYLIQHYVIKFVNDIPQVGGFLRVLRFPPRHDITEILLKVALNTIIQTKPNDI